MTRCRPSSLSDPLFIYLLIYNGNFKNLIDVYDNVFWLEKFFKFFIVSKARNAQVTFAENLKRKVNIYPWSNKALKGIDENLQKKIIFHIYNIYFPFINWKEFILGSVFVQIAHSQSSGCGILHEGKQI